MALAYTYVCARASTPTCTHTVGCMGRRGRPTVRSRIESAIQRLIPRKHRAVHRDRQRAVCWSVVKPHHANKTTLVSCWSGNVRYYSNTRRRLEIGTGTRAGNVECLMQRQRPGASMRPGCAASWVPVHVSCMSVPSALEEAVGARPAACRRSWTDPPARPGTLLQALPGSGGEGGGRYNELFLFVSCGLS